jgi:hypothetical protein
MENRHFVAVLAIPSTSDIHAIRDDVLCKLKTLAEQATGSSDRVSGLASLTRPLSINAGEVTGRRQRAWDLAAAYRLG